MVSSAYSELLEKYKNICTKYEGKSKENSPNDSEQLPASGPRLKDIEISEFHGNFPELISFKPVFELQAHNNQKYFNP